MARLDVHTRRDGEPGWLIDVQSDLLSILATRVVVPLLPEQGDRMPAGRLHPIFEIEGQRVVMATQFVTAIPARELGNRVATLEEAHDEVTGALDMLLTGV